MTMLMRFPQGCFVNGFEIHVMKIYITSLSMTLQMLIRPSHNFTIAKRAMMLYHVEMYNKYQK